MKYLKLTIIIALLMIIIPQLSARFINLEQCQEMLENQNRNIEAGKSGVKSAQWQQFDAFGNFLPQISFNSTIVRIDDESYDEANAGFDIPGIGTFPALMPVYKTTYQNSITAQQPIFNGGKVIIGYQLAKLMRTQAEFELENTRNDAVFSGISNFIQILKLQDLLKLAQLSLNASQSQLDSMREKEKVGLALESDVLQWEVKVENDRMAVKEIENNLTIVNKMWINQLNTEEEELEPASIDLSSYITAAEQKAAISADQRVLQIKDFINQVKQSNPTIQNMETSNLIMKKNLLMSKGNFLPSLNLQFTYEIEEDDSFDFDGEDNWNLAALISMPLFTGGKNLSKVKSTSFEQRKLKKQISAATDEVLTAAENSYRMLFILAEKIVSNQKSVASARENHRLINQYFQQNLVTNTELLNAETMLYSSEMNFTAACYDYIIQLFDLKRWSNK